MSNKNIAVYVSSYDGCADLWNVFFNLFDKFWTDCDYPIYLINNEREYVHSKVQVLHTGEEINWFHRTIKSLEQIEEEYVVFLLEDYFLSKRVNNIDVAEIVDFMQKEDVYFYMLSKRAGQPEEQIRYSVDATTRYVVSLQPAIWNRKKLLEILYEIGGKTPWDFELYFSEKYKGKSGTVEGVFYDTRDILGYKNGVLRGKWIPDTLRFYKRLGIEIEIGSREILPFKTVLKYKVATWVSRNFSTDFKEKIKVVLKKINFDYVR